MECRRPPYQGVGGIVMAGVIRISYRYEHGMHVWTAKPDFVCAGMTWGQEPIVEAGSSEVAFHKLRWAMYELDIPTEYKRMLSLLDRRNFYKSPERDNGMDLCVDMDGKRPTFEQYKERREKYLLRKRIDESINRTNNK